MTTNVTSQKSWLASYQIYSLTQEVVNYTIHKIKENM